MFKFRIIDNENLFPWIILSTNNQTLYIYTLNPMSTPYNYYNNRNYTFRTFDRAYLNKNLCAQGKKKQCSTVNFLRFFKNIH